MKMRSIRLGWMILLCVASMATPLAAQQTIAVKPLPAQPVVDGRAAEWDAVREVKIPVKGVVGVGSVHMRAGTSGDSVYFLVRWQDSSADTQHKPFLWDAAKERYVGGPQREDRFALQFAMSGDYTTDWFAGVAFSADTWHWKAARSNPLGLAHDKMTIITLDKVARAYKAQARNGSTIYIMRPADAGDKLYTTKRYRERQQNVMPKYILTDDPSGSVADVMAAGRWQDGWWTLELARRLDTGHADDVVFTPGQSVRGGIAVFNHTGDDKHDISETLVFAF